jgi:hypothetical protein
VNKAHLLPVEVAHVLNGHGVPVQVTNPSSAVEIVSLLGPLLALVAIIYAASSAKAATKSADAADATLKLMQEEAEAARDERARRADPVALLHVGWHSVTPATGRADVILTAAFRNEGNRPAERLFVNFLIPGTLGFYICNQFGNKQDAKIAFTPETPADKDESALDGFSGSFYWEEDIGPLDPRAMNKVQYLRLVAPESGHYYVKCALIQQDIPSGLRTWLWRITIPSDTKEPSVVIVEGPTPPMRDLPPRLDE